MLRLEMDILGAVVGGGVLRQQRLGTKRLLLGILLLAGGETFLGQRQGRHADLIFAPISGRQQMPTLRFLVLGAQSIVEKGDRALIHLWIIRLYVGLRERNAQQGRARREPYRLLVGRDRLGDASILEQHLPLELAIIGILREVPYQPV